MKLNTLNKGMKIEYLVNNITDVLKQLEVAIRSLPLGIYHTKSAVLSGASIGAHVRHTIELYQELLTGYDNGIVNYDNRKRDYNIETDYVLAQSCLQNIINKIGKENRVLELQIGATSDGVLIESNYYRELLYNMEHTIHHMALIRIGIEDLTDIRLPSTFGVASATIIYRTTCAQ